MIFCIIGLSCVGKSTVVDMIKEMYGIRGIKQYTTRSEREGKEEKDYIFVSEEEYNELEKKNRILATRKFEIECREYKYGIPNDISNKETYIMPIDPEGYLKLKNNIDNLVVILLTVDTMKLIERYKKRGGKNLEEFKIRMQKDQKEINKIKDEIGYFIENNDISNSVIEIKKIILNS
ncbi:hypothetical protein [Clostridium ganghwense]|uniref:Guanylate kinase-like domain-containing protein n=1 Tax=Clostridium ganghwense TaxID=312089 RepID=A0ABT4CLN2_9CLOT|nr:hypothetical protein [Clostridium ganghwense]MCY6369955.1 hypothetical protein [Clostridium ganghwense]